jgi:hypothetical protein
MKGFFGKQLITRINPIKRRGKAIPANQNEAFDWQNDIRK